MPEKLKIDEPAYLHPFIGKCKPKQENRELFMNNYASRFELPASFVLNAHGFREMAPRGFFYQVVRFIMPSEKSVKIVPEYTRFNKDSFGIYFRL